jgi:hypothetical protein
MKNEMIPYHSAFSCYNNNNSYKHHLKGDQNWTGCSGSNKWFARHAVATKMGMNGDITISKGVFKSRDTLLPAKE